MKDEKSPSHILILILLIAHLLFSNYMINQLEGNVLNKRIEIQNLEKELDLKNDKLQNTKMNYKILNEEIKNVKEVRSEWKKFFVTGYTANSGEQGTNEIVATMFNLDLNRVKNLPIIAVDPEVIPLFSIVEIEDFGAFIALDTGGLIKGNRIDILFDSKQEAINFGKQIMKVRIIK